MAMPVVKVKARTMARNIFFIDDLPQAGYRNDTAPNNRMLFLRENT
jgi:hypothetical protein